MRDIIFTHILMLVRAPQRPRTRKRDTAHTTQKRIYINDMVRQSQRLSLFVCVRVRAPTPRVCVKTGANIVAWIWLNTSVRAAVSVGKCSVCVRVSMCAQHTGKCILQPE